jgi:hypothetical protein
MFPRVQWTWTPERSRCPRTLHGAAREARLLQYPNIVWNDVPEESAEALRLADTEAVRRLGIREPESFRLFRARHRPLGGDDPRPRAGRVSAGDTGLRMG